MFKKLYFNNEERQNNTVVQTFFPIILEIKPKKIFKSIHVIWKYIFKTWEANLVLLPSKTTTTSSSLFLKSWSEISECGRPLSPMLGEGQLHSLRSNQSSVPSLLYYLESCIFTCHVPSLSTPASMMTDSLTRGSTTKDISPDSLVGITESKKTEPLWEFGCVTLRLTGTWFSR